MNADRIVRTLDVVAQTVTFECNGKKITVDAKTLSAEVRDRAMLHGLNQTIGDAAAIETKEVDGKMHRPTCAEKIAAMRERIETLQSGKWSESPEKMAKIPDLIQAVMNVTGVTQEEARATYEGLSKDQRAQLRAEPTVSLEMAKIRARRMGLRPAEPTKSILARFTK